MTQESLHRIKRYIQMLDEKPIRHSHDIINGVHAGTEWEAELRLSDIRNVIHEVEKLRAALRKLYDHEGERVLNSIGIECYTVELEDALCEARAALGEKE